MIKDRYHSYDKGTMGGVNSLLIGLYGSQRTHASEQENVITPGSGKNNKILNPML